MLLLLSFIGITIFLAGLYQWAQTGSSLWRIFSLRRHGKELSREELQQTEREVKQLEASADRTLSASFRILAVLAVLTWLVLGATMVLDLLGIDWTGTLNVRAQSYWAAPGVTSQTNTIPGRNDMIRNLGTSLRR